MKTSLLFLLTFLTLTATSAPVWAGNCDHSWDTAADGSNCGARSADSRAGGRDPAPWH